MTVLREMAMYPAVRAFLEGQGYAVKAEIHDCDVTAVHPEGMVVIVEMKTVLNLRLVMQGVARQEITDDVYLAVPDDTPVLRKESRGVLRLLRMLGLGLLAVDVKKNRVLPLLDPGEFRPRKRKARQTRLLKAFTQLVGDPNDGRRGSGKGFMTVYRQSALDVAEYLITHGPTKASVVRDAVQEPRAWQILHSNVYGWFEKVEKGVYGISPRGEREFREWRPLPLSSCHG